MGKKMDKMLKVRCRNDVYMFVEEKSDMWGVSKSEAIRIMLYDRMVKMSSSRGKREDGNMRTGNDFPFPNDPQISYKSDRIF